MARARRNQRYTQTELKTMTELYERGESLASIARKLGRTKHAIMVRVGRLKITRGLAEEAEQSLIGDETEEILRVIMNSQLSAAKKVRIATRLL